MELIQTIRNEIERLKEEHLTRNSIGVITGSGVFVNAASLLAFLDTLQEQEVKEQKSQDTVGRVSIEIRSNLQTDEVVRKTLIMLVNDGRISVTGAITSSDILNWLEGQKEPEGLHFTPISRLLQKIPSDKWAGSVNGYAKKLCDCLIHEGYLKDAQVVQGYISYMNGHNVPMATMDDAQESKVDCFKIKGWVAREPKFNLMLFTAKPERFGEMWDVMAGEEMPINSSLFPDLRWEDEPIEVELLIKRI